SFLPACDLLALQGHHVELALDRPERPRLRLRHRSAPTKNPSRCRDGKALYELPRYHPRLTDGAPRASRSALSPRPWPKPSALTVMRPVSLGHHARAATTPSAAAGPPSVRANATRRDQVASPAIADWLASANAQATSEAASGTSAQLIVPRVRTRASVAQAG